jgi:glycosyltransferase involved in cell wall biosynthesis
VGGAVTVDLSVLVPTYARAGTVRRLLDALSLQTLAPDRFEVIVAIDGSRDGTLELVNDYRASYRLSSIWQENSGRAAARNRAISRASAPLLLLFDDDMEPASECLAAHLGTHERGERLCVVGAAPIQLRPGDPPIARYFQAKFAAHLERLSEPGHRFVARDFYSGHFSLERSLLLEVGLFDDSFTGYGNEDVDLALRLREAGAEIVYEPRAVAQQHFDKDVSRAFGDAQAKGHTALRVACKHPDALAEMRLGTYEQRSTRWRALRRVLLTASRRSRLVSQLVEAVSRLLERSGRELPRQYYDFLLDFGFWLGVEAELKASAARLSSPDLVLVPPTDQHGQPVP